MIILGIETSCDDTSIALVEDGQKILAHQISSQHKLHEVYGGIVPEVAARRHLETILPMLDHTMNEGGVKFREVDAIAVTTHPGLIGSLLTGINTAKTLAYHLELPLIQVSHLRAHFYSLNMSTQIDYPYLGLLVSGGHTLLAICRSANQVEVVGHTLDDACGECFDKVAKHYQIGYPGGPYIEKLAEQGNDDAYHFPRSLEFSATSNHPDRFNFSYSGLKTAVIYHREKYRQVSKDDGEEEVDLPNLVAGFQKAALEVLVNKSVMAAKENNIDHIGVCGGVSANKKLKSLFQVAMNKHPQIKVFFPDFQLCTDNAAMIAGLAYQTYLQNPVKFRSTSKEDLFQVTAHPKSFRANQVL